MGKLKTRSPVLCIMDNLWNMLIVTKDSTKFIWQAFYELNVFRYICTMMKLKWWNVQTNEYDLQAKSYSTIRTHHKLRNNDNKANLRDLKAATGL